MKKLLIAFALLSYNSFALAHSCPAGGETALKLIQYRPGAQIHSSQGECQVQVLQYAGYEVDADWHAYESEKKVACDFNHLSSHYLKARVSYVNRASRCGSILGCHVDCIAIVEDSSIR